jgi:hypoxanthine phosphoribosyltransferase
MCPVQQTKHRLIDIPLKYVGFDLPDRFVVGYGLDYRERYRNLRYIGLLKSTVLRDHPEP